MSLRHLMKEQRILTPYFDSLPHMTSLLVAILTIDSIGQRIYYSCHSTSSSINMKRKELQELCKNHGIPANLSNVEMANRLSSIFKGSEKEKPMIRGQSCLKAVGDGENDSDGVNRKAKKVRFSPENELIEFTKSIAKRGCRRKSRMGNSCLIVENACSVELNQRTAKRSPVRVTRSRGLQLLDGGDAEKKVTKRGLNGNGRVEKLCSDNEVRVATRRALRNREMQDEGLRESEGVVEGLRKSERQQNSGSAKGIEDVSESKQIGEEPHGAFRRSKRNVAKKDNEDVGKNENNNGGRLGRKQALLEVEASELEMDGVRFAENGVALVTGDNKEVGVVTRRSLRNREITVEGKKEREEDNAGLRRSGRQSKQGPLGSHGVLQSQNILEEPKKDLRRSKRNVSKVKDTERSVTLAKDTVMFDENKNSGKVRLGRNQIKLEVKTCKREAAGLKIAEDSFASSNGENRACTKRLLRNKKVAVSEDIDEGLKKMGGQTSIRNEKSGEEGPQNKQIEEELSKGLRRSKRTAAKMDESKYPYQGIGKSKMVRKEQKTRSQFAKSVEASILEAMPATEIAALEKNEVGKEPAKAAIGSSPQNSMMPLLEKATKETEASSFGAMSETETADERRLEVLIQVEEPTSISPRSSSFNTQFETESAALSRLEVVNQVRERTSASPRRATVQKSGATFGNVHQNMNQNLSSHLTSNASLEVEVIKDDEMSEADGLKHKTVMFYCNSSIDEQVDSNKTVASRELSNNSSKSFDEHEGTLAEEMRTSRRNASDETGRIHNATVNAAVEKESCNKKSTPAETSSQQLRVDATRDDKIVQPVGEDKGSGNKNMALGVSIAEDLTKINEQCTHVALLSGITDTETTKEPTSTEPLMDESCLEGNESEGTRHKINQVSPNNVGDRIGEVGEVKIPQLVSGVEYSRSDLVDLHTDTEVQIVDIPVTESKGFAEMVKVSMEVNVENSLDDLEVANLAEQEPPEDFNFDIDSASIEANSTINCYKSNGQLYLTAGVKEMQKKELTEIGYAESVGKEDEIAGENELVVIAEPLNRANEKSPETQVSLVEDRMSNGEKKSLQIGDCTQVAVLSCVEVTDILNEPMNSGSFIDDTIMTSNKFEESAKQSKQRLSPKVVNRKKMEEVNSPQLENAIKESFSELVTSHTDHVEQEKVLVDEIKDISDKVNISLEENIEKSLGGLVGHTLAHCKTYDGLNVDRENEMEEVNSPQLENAIKQSFSELVTSHTDHVEQEKVLVDEIKDISDKVNISLEENIEKSLGGLVGHTLAHCETYDGLNVDRENEMEEVNSPQLENAIKESSTELVTFHTDHVEQEKVLVNGLKDFSDKVNISLEENTDKSLGGLVGYNVVHCETYDGVNVDREEEMEEVNSPQLDNAVKESFAELVTSHTDHVEQEKVLVDEIKDFSDKVNISLEENAEKPLGGLVGHNLGLCKTYDGINVDREKEMEEVNSPQLENAVKESFSKLVTSHNDHEDQEKVLVDERKDFFDKVNISLEENAEKSLGGFVGHNPVHSITYDGINVDRDTVPFEIISPTKAYASDTKEKQTEEVAELQYACSLSKGIGSTIQLVEHAVRGELSGEKKLAVNAADSVNIFATMKVPNDVLQDTLDDRPGENLEDGSQRFEKAGFVDSSEKHKCDASILELHAGKCREHRCWIYLYK
nr:Serine-rich adhesin for platelets like [Ipomoea batatas]